ncbi:Triacylglycerol lipase [Penicillium frequentans]|uniref:Triacylglycerol lipase n=1 Tax=Penicillium frequentans TaxID=3151616 RepID=A0AAD6D9H1_9EURO|nr:Triacylglycerol lipase [Penicillium glabrum]
MRLPEPREWILIVSVMLESVKSFDERHPELIEDLETEFNIQTINDPHLVVTLLEDMPERQSSLPKAVFVVDKALLLPSNHFVWDAILGYVRKGGLCITMGHFALCKETDNSFFRMAGLSWGLGRCDRVILTLNQATARGFMDASLPNMFDMHGTTLINVDPDHRLYNIGAPLSKDFSRNVPEESTVAMAHVGHGWLAYVGDENIGSGSRQVIDAMCGLFRRF